MDRTEILMAYGTVFEFGVLHTLPRFLTSSPTLPLNEEEHTDRILFHPFPPGEGRRQIRHGPIHQQGRQGEGTGHIYHRRHVEKVVSLTVHVYHLINKAGRVREQATFIIAAE